MAPHISRPAKAANNFIAHHQDAVLPAYRLDLGPIIGWRNNDPTRALNRLADKGSDILGTNFDDFIFDSLRTDCPEFFRRHVAALIIPIRLTNMLNTRKWQYAGCRETLSVHRLHATHADSRHGRAMIGIVPANEDRPAALAFHLPIMTHHPQNGVIRF